MKVKVHRLGSLASSGTSTLDPGATVRAEVDHVVQSTFGSSSAGSAGGGGGFRDGAGAGAGAGAGGFGAGCDGGGGGGGGSLGIAPAAVIMETSPSMMAQ